eukprot:scaffold12452_cov113-Isochrysis_galbana.AAC.8
MPCDCTERTGRHEVGQVCHRFLGGLLWRARFLGRGVTSPLAGFILRSIIAKPVQDAPRQLLAVAKADAGPGAHLVHRIGHQMLRSGAGSVAAWRAMPCHGIRCCTQHLSVCLVHDGRGFALGASRATSMSGRTRLDDAMERLRGRCSGWARIARNDSLSMRLVGFKQGVILLRWQRLPTRGWTNWLLRLPRLEELLRSLWSRLELRLERVRGLLRLLRRLQSLHVVLRLPRFVLEVRMLLRLEHTSDGLESQGSAAGFSRRDHGGRAARRLDGFWKRRNGEAPDRRRGHRACHRLQMLHVPAACARRMWLASTMSRASTSHRHSACCGSVAVANRNGFGREVETRAVFCRRLRAWLALRGRGSRLRRAETIEKGRGSRIRFWRRGRFVGSGTRATSRCFLATTILLDLAVLATQRPASFGAAGRFPSRAEDGAPAAGAPVAQTWLGCMKGVSPKRSASGFWSASRWCGKSIPAWSDPARSSSLSHTSRVARISNGPVALPRCCADPRVWAGVAVSLRSPSVPFVAVALRRFGTDAGAPSTGDMTIVPVAPGSSICPLESRPNECSLTRCAAKWCFAFCGGTDSEKDSSPWPLETSTLLSLRVSSSWPSALATSSRHFESGTACMGAKGIGGNAL